MAAIQYKPTRMELSNLKKRLKTAVRGHKMMKDKRDELVRRFIVLARKNKELREQTEAKMAVAMQNFVLAKATMSNNEIEEALLYPARGIQVDAEKQNILSIPVPKLSMSTSEEIVYPYGFSSTSSDLDGAVQAIAEALPPPGQRPRIRHDPPVHRGHPHHPDEAGRERARESVPAHEDQGDAAVPGPMNLTELVQQAGFSAGYLLPVPQYEEWTRRRASGAFAPEADWIEGDPAAAWPWANGLLLLIWPYAPYAPDAGLSGYYPASHQSYHAMMGLKKALEAVGVRAERAAVPVKSLLVAWGLAACLDSDMLYMPGIGTRFVIQALMVALPEDELTFTPKQAPFQACIHCKRCQRACPGGAISPQGYDWRKCLRAYEDGPQMPAWVMERMTCLLGCEVCQDVCPLNHFIQPRPVTEEEKAAFDLGRLIAGDIKPALALIGKNMKKGGKLTAQAAVLAANQNRTDLLPLLEEQAARTDGPLKDTLLWAISKLQHI